MQERLQKIISRAGITSRRKAEELIEAGRVSVNGRTVTELGEKADLDVDDIKVNGQRLREPNRLVYVALNKPKNVLTTLHDPEGRETVKQLVPLKERIFPVGRLDYQSEGLLLLTNDGEFMNRITSPTNKVPKVYHVKATGKLTPEQLESFREGVPLHGRRTQPAEIKLISKKENPWYEVTIMEGRQNQIRNMFKHMGLLVEKLRRERIGFLNLGKMKPGEFRFLTPAEVQRFRRQLGMEKTGEEIAQQPGEQRPVKRRTIAQKRAVKRVRAAE